MKRTKILDLYGFLRDAGVVESQYDFSRLCGRSPSYASSLKSQGKEISLAAMASLARNLGSRSQRASTDAERESLQWASSMVEFEVYQVVKGRNEPVGDD